MGKLTFLGTGSSMGVPQIGCNCKVCQSSLSKNKRFRSSCLIEAANKRFILDVSPDIRLQALKAKIDHIDGVLLTHPHYDHVGGLDDLRVFNFLQKKKIPCLVSLETLAVLEKSYFYLFQEKGQKTSLSVELSFHKLTQEEGKKTFQNLPLRYFSYQQGSCKVTGYRFCDLAYVTDIKEYDPKIFSFLKDIKTLVISAPRYQISPVNFSIEEAITFGKKSQAKEVYLMHLSHEIDHEILQKELPSHFFPAYDGLELNF